MNKKSTFIDLFAGCGGLSLGLEQAGFTPVYVNELNKDALETYLVNRNEYPLLRDPRFHSRDIYELTKKNKLNELSNNLKKEFNLKKGDVSLVVGGPPCQGFSGIGHRRNYFVEKEKIPSNFLYREMVKVIKHIEPKGFIFENVRGLLNSKWTKDGEKGEIFEDVKKEFSKLKNYFFDYALVQSKDYGVPQNRPRIILIGIRKDIVFNELFLDFDEDLVIVEGVFDAIVAGPNAVPLLGSTLSENHPLLEKIVENDTPVYIGMDADAKKKELKIINLLLKHDIEIRKINIEPFSDIGQMKREIFLDKKQSAVLVNSENYLYEVIKEAL